MSGTGTRGRPSCSRRALAVTEVLDGPAENAGLKPGMIIQSLNDTPIHSEAQLRSVIENSTHKAPIPITVLVPGEDGALGDWFVRDESVVTVNLTSKWIWYYTHYNYLNEEEYKNLSFMGIDVAPFGLTVVEAEHLTDLYAHPYAQRRGPRGPRGLHRQAAGAPVHRLLPGASAGDGPVRAGRARVRAPGRASSGRS